MGSERPTLIRTDVVGRAILTLAGFTLPDLADALSPDPVTPGWLETGYIGARAGMPAMDLVPTPGVPTLGNGNRRTTGGLHLFTADWKDDRTCMQGPAVIVEGTRFPETVLTAMIGMRFGGVVAADGLTDEIADARISWIERPDPTDVRHQTMLGLDPLWIDQPTLKERT